MDINSNFNPHEVLADKNNFKCTCPETDCEWSGACKECVTLHRFCKTIPNCLDFNAED